MYLVRKFKKIALIALFSLTAYAGVSQASTSVSLDLGADKSFTFKNVDADGNKVSSDAIVNAVVQAIFDSSGYKSLSKTFATSAVYDVQGVGIYKTPNEIEVSYENGEFYANTGNTLTTRSSAKFGYSLEDAAGSITVTLVPPKLIETKKQASPIFFPYRQFASDEKLVSDIQQIYSKLNPIIVLTKIVRGEVNAKYAATPITANFKRKCSSISLVKDGSFTCTVDNKEVALEVLPYKEGSKVTYQFSVKYSLNGKGESDYSPESTKKVILGITNIVND